MKPPRVVITIDEITLHAFDGPSPAATASVLERELARIFTAQPVTARHGIRVAHLSVPPIAIAPGAPAGALAVGLAEHVHGGVAAATKPPKRRP
jgi:hypothetical protein